MKANEIIFRQNRVIYTLMILLAGIGLVWSFWQHQHKDEPAAPAAATSSVPTGHAAVRTVSTVR